VLEGMRTIVENSPDIKILFEKLVVNAGSENELQTYFRSAGFDLYALGADVSRLFAFRGEVAQIRAVSVLVEARGGAQ
jgi:hypothetical protein